MNNGTILHIVIALFSGHNICDCGRGGEMVYGDMDPLVVSMSKCWHLGSLGRSRLFVRFRLKRPPLLSIPLLY